MADDPWASFNPQPVAPQGDAWAAFKPEGAGAEPNVLPQAFVDRLQHGEQIKQSFEQQWAKPYSQRLKEWSAQALQEGNYPAVGLGTVSAFLAGIPEMIASGVMLAKDTMDGRVISGAGLRKEDFSTDPNAPEPLDVLQQRAMDMAMAGGVRSTFGEQRPLIRTQDGQVARPFTDADGTMRAHVVGQMPMAEDFTNAAHVIGSISPPEKIVSAAQRTPDGLIFTGTTHGEAFASAAKVGQAGNATESGFMTDAGRFVDREEAAKIAKASDQFNDSFDSRYLKAEQLKPIVEKNLRQLWQEQGLHPSEVAHDAQSDGLLRHDLSSAASPTMADIVMEGRQALIKNADAIAAFAQKYGWSDVQIKALIDDNFSSPKYRAKTYAEFLAAKEAMPAVPRSLSSAATSQQDIPPLSPPDTQPLSQPGRLMAAARSSMDRMFEFGQDIQMQLSPMAVGAEIIPKATAKDFSNSLRRNTWYEQSLLAETDKKFTPEQQARMFHALDEESVMRQDERISEHMGLATLEPAERAHVEKIMAHNLADWVHMAELNMVKGEPIPAYAARIATGLKSGDVQGSMPINALGLNLKTTTARLKGRKYLTVDETEAALKAKYPEAEITRNIKANIMAMKQERDAIAGRTLVEKIKEYGKNVNNEQVAEGFKPGNEWFTIDHPALKTWRPKLEKGPDDTWQIVKSESGDTQFEKVPIYIHNDWEGPLRAVLSRPAGNVATALMDVKSKTMSVIMYSPFIHNAVIYSKALAGFKANVIKTTKMYFDGYRIKNDPAQMLEFIDGGMVPIGKRFFKQDITDQMTSPNLTHGDSLTAKMISAVPGLFSEGAELATKKAIDKLGNFYHNTLLWDRVADLQAGVAAHFRDEFLSSGMDRQTAVRMAAHESNRLAGSLPVESMSAGARTVANTLLFSRTFTLGNIGIMKDMLTGLPKDVLAQIERDAGPEAVKSAKSLARRQAFATVVTDMALFYVGTSILQNAANVILGSSNLSDEAMNYWTRLKKELEAKASNPWAAVPPWGIYSFLQNISATAGNEPGKQDRVHIGYTKDGTAIYGKSPMGRIGEEFSSYSQGFWLDLMHRKLGTIVRPLWEIYSNDRGFGRKLYDPHIDSVTGSLNAAWEMAKHLVEAQLPKTQMEAFGNLVKGEGDKKLNLLQTVGPFLPPPFTFTASKGAPGGPAVGEFYDAKSQFEFRVQQAMPGIRQMLRRGDTQQADEQMIKLGMDAGYRRWIKKTDQNPALRMSPSGMRKFNQYATPEQKLRLENQLTPGPLTPEQ